MSLRGVADQVLSLLRPRIEEKTLEVGNEIAGDLPPARADRQRGRAGVHQPARQRHQVLRPPARSFRLRAAADVERGLRVEIADTGPGIEPRHLPRLFERFYRVDSGRSRDMGGTGLGLSIVKHLVEAMGGTIGVESTPGRGSTFWFTLPRRRRSRQICLTETGLRTDPWNRRNYPLPAGICHRFVTRLYPCPWQGALPFSPCRPPSERCEG